MQGHRLSIDWLLLTDLVYRHRQYGQGVYQRNARNGSHVLNKTLSWRGPNAGKKRAIKGEHRYTRPPEGKELGMVQLLPKVTRGKGERKVGRWGLWGAHREQNVYMPGCVSSQTR